METQINSDFLNKVVLDVVDMDSRGEKPISGLMAKRIREEGRYVEGGLEFTKNDLLLGQLYSSVAVLARDMYRYVDDNQDKDATKFFKEQLVQPVHDVDYKLYGDGAFPRYAGLPDEFAPPTVDLNIPDGHIDLKPLEDAELICERHFKPGKRLLVTLTGHADVRKAVCGEDKLKGFIREADKKVVQPVVVALVAQAIITATFTAAMFWYPLAAFAAIYIVKKNLKKYCHV